MRRLQKMAGQPGGIVLKKATVVIPNYNGKHFLEPCMEALRAQKCRDFKVLVIDNASTDGSVEYLRENYPEAEIAVMKENLGFSGGVNEGIRRSKTEYVILLNNDTAVEPDYVGELIKAADRDKRIFSVSAKMVCMHQPEKMDDAGDLYTIMGWSAQKGIDRPANKYDKASPIFTSCAGAGLYRRKVFDKIGLFDEMHFAYLEDVDVGYRARLYGYTNVYAPKAVCRHVGSGTSGSKYNSFKVKLAARNSIYVIYKNMAAWQIIVNAPAILLGFIIKLVFFAAMGYFKEYSSGLIEGFRTFKKCRRVVGVSTFVTQLAIEAMMLFDTVVYTTEFIKRRLDK